MFVFLAKESRFQKFLQSLLHLSPVFGMDNAKPLPGAYHEKPRRSASSFSRGGKAPAPLNVGFRAPQTVRNRNRHLAELGFNGAQRVLHAFLLCNIFPRSDAAPVGPPDIVGHFQPGRFPSEVNLLEKNFHVNGASVFLPVRPYAPRIRSFPGCLKVLQEARNILSDGDVLDGHR